MTKGTYWLTGPGDTYVFVEGAARRDELAGHGWTETTAPLELDRVWLHHPDTGGWAKFPAAGVDAALAKGWQHDIPPTRPTEQGAEIVLPDPAPIEQSTPEPVLLEPVQTPPPADKPKNEKEKEGPRA